MGPDEIRFILVRLNILRTGFFSPAQVHVLNLQIVNNTFTNKEFKQFFIEYKNLSVKYHYKARNASLFFQVPKTIISSIIQLFWHFFFVRQS